VMQEMNKIFGRTQNNVDVKNIQKTAM